MQPIASPSGGAGATDRADASAPAGDQEKRSDPPYKQHMGRRGEDLAVAHLQRAGFRVLERNWRCAAGEIDIVASDGPTIVGCEVKTRSAPTHGQPQEGVNDQKLSRLYRLTHRWVEQNGRPTTTVRVDVIGVLLAPGREPWIDHLVGAC